MGFLTSLNLLAPQVCVLILQDLFAIELSSNGADSSFPLFLQIMITNLKIKKKYNCNHTYLKHEELQKIRTIFASKIKLVFSLVIKGHLVIFCYNLVSSLPILLAAFFWVQIKKINLSFLRIYRPRVIFCAKYSAFGSFDQKKWQDEKNTQSQFNFLVMLLHNSDYKGCVTANCIAFCLPLIWTGSHQTQLQNIYSPE